MKIADVIEQSARRYASHPCIAYLCHNGAEPSVPSAHVLTYRGANQALNEHALWLTRWIPSSDRETSKVVVAYLSSNTADYLLSLLAASSLRKAPDITVALLNTRWTPHEMASSLQSSQSSSTTILLYEPGWEPVARQVTQHLMHRSWCLPIPKVARAYLVPLSSVVEFNTSIKYAPVEVLGDSFDNDDAVVVFTSGTTTSAGGAKGVRLSHRALLVQALAKCQAPCNYDPHTNMLATTVPLFHVAGLSSALAVLLAGGTWVFPSTHPTTKGSGGFDPSLTWNSLATSPLSPDQAPFVNTLVVVPAMLHAMLRQTDAQKAIPTVVYSAVRLILIGGQSAPASMVRQLRRIFPNARLVQTYACTEAASSLTFLDVTDREAPCRPNGSDVLEDMLTVSLPNRGPFGDCVGMPPSHVELVLFQHTEDNESSVQRQQRLVLNDAFKVGIFATRGPHVMSGYWIRNEEGRSSPFSRSLDWFCTNDLGFQDEQGRFYFCGRVKDLIRTGGETVVATEVERTLLQHGAIEDCAVFALPDERYGEAVCAAIVIKTGETKLSLEQLRDFCAERGLAGYKKPLRVFFLKELPRNASGKLLKYRLVERFQEKSQVQSKL